MRFWIGVTVLCLGALLVMSCNSSVERLLRGDRADVIVREMNEMQQLGRVGDTVGCIMDSNFCNAGGTPQDWMALPDGRHPFVTFNLYRLKDDRFEQIGQSWAKHGSGAGQGDECTLGCIPIVDGSQLGVGCSDTYSLRFNREQSMFGPRHEINPFTGAFAYAGSHFEASGLIGGGGTQTTEHDPIQHRLQVHDAELDAATNAGAVYVCEQFIVSHDDADVLNSVAHEAVVVSGAPGDMWQFDISGAGTQEGPAIRAWADARITMIPETPVDDGRCLLAAKAAIRGTTWRYEYALFNLDMDRAVRRFRMPVPAGVTVTNVGFHAVASHDEPFSNEPWIAVQDGQTLTWETAACCAEPANPLRWGTLYNFRFDADAVPKETAAVLGLYKPGTPEELAGVTIGP